MSRRITVSVQSRIQERLGEGGVRMADFEKCFSVPGNAGVLLQRSATEIAELGD